ncbi:MAG: dihydrodipicolinate synthase family protein [Clostridiaceae bacterium]
MMKKLYGVTTPIVTPFNDNGLVDLGAVGHITDFLIEKGVNCLYPLGTTGEMLRLSVNERKAVAEKVVSQAAGRCVVYIHCGAARQDDTVELVKHAEAIGADGAGVVTPQFFGLNDREMETYYLTVSKSVSKDFPIYLYNIPQCSGNDLKPQVVENIVKQCENVVGIKYSFADMVRTNDYLRVNGGKFSVLHGCDSLFLPTLMMGCDGTVSGISGVYPEPFVALYKAYLMNDLAEAKRQQDIAIDIIKILRSGSNMAYFKAALEYRGIPGGHMRAPQLDLLEEEKKEMIEELKKRCNFL